MSQRGNQLNWFVFTMDGAFAQSGETAKIALARFRRQQPGQEVVGLMREDLVVKPPAKKSGRPFLCMFIQEEKEGIGK